MRDRAPRLLPADRALTGNKAWKGGWGGKVSSSLVTWIEVQFMKKAVDVVFKCRMTLKWTYAMAYYLAMGNKKALFEDNQR